MDRNRKIGALLATALVASNMIGSGIFLLPATLAAVGSVTVIGWGLATAGALLIAVTLARLGRIAPQAGGPCTYAADTMGPYWGFQATTIYWLSCWSGNIAIAVTATSYLAAFVPVLAQPLPAAIATCALIWVVSLINIYGPRLVCQLESGAIFLGLIPILLVAVAGWWHFDAALFQASWNVQHLPVTSVVPQSLVLVFWAFTGLESASITADVVEKPHRNVPIATIGGVLLAALVYISACTVVMGLIPAADLAKSSAPFGDAVKLLFGPAAGGLITVLALIKTTGTLGGWVLLTAKTSQAGAARGLFPAWFARTDRHGIPVPGLLAMAAVMCVVVFATISPTVNAQFSKVIELSVIFSLLTYCYGCVALWKLDAAAPKRWRYRLLAGAALLFCLWVIAESEAGDIWLSVAALLLTVPGWWLLRRPRPGSSPGSGSDGLGDLNA
jgi:arginine:agmatine antiporter